jgi:hypothetical protein
VTPAEYVQRQSEAQAGEVEGSEAKAGTIDATAHLKNEMRAKSTKEPSSRSPENAAKALARSPSWAGESEAVAFLRRVLAAEASHEADERLSL